MTQAHKLKTWPEPFAETWAGRKTFEYRNDDRNYQVGDVLELAEYDPKTREYTGRQVTAAVTYILRGPAWGVPEGMCIMSLSLALAKG